MKGFDKKNALFEPKIKAQKGLTAEFVVGIVRSPHGVSGEFKVESTSGEREHFARMTEVTLRDAKTKESRTYKVERVEIGGSDLYMKISGIDSLEEAKKLSQQEIVVPRDNARPLGKDEWYVEDLKGCSLVFGGKNGLSNGVSAVVGTVTNVMEGGAGDLLEVVLAEDSEILDDSVKFFRAKDGSLKARTVFVPLKKEAGFIGKVDILEKKIELMHLWILE